MTENIKVELEAGVIVLSGLILVAFIGPSVGSVLLYVLFPLSILIALGMHSGRHQPPGVAAHSKRRSAATRRALTQRPARGS